MANRQGNVDFRFDQVSAPQLTLGKAWGGLVCWGWEILTLCHTCNDDDNDDDDDDDDSNFNNNESLMEKCEYIKRKIG
jgi:hypothetical protein